MKPRGYAEPEHIYRMAELPAVTGLGKTTIFRLIETGDFPPPMKLTDAPRRPSVGWLASTITEWQRRRAAKVESAADRRARAPEPARARIAQTTAKR